MSASKRSKGSLDCIFKPSSIAVIGASRNRGTIGREILHNLLLYEFKGTLFPVNPNVEVVNSIKSYPSILDVPDNVDLAIIVVPQPQVVKVIDECGRKGVKGLVIISAGFKESGKKGAIEEEKVVRLLRKYRMRAVGPNCMGIVNTDPDINMNATFAATTPGRGTIGFMSQSGALGEAILSMARELNLGFSHFISVGNKADISGNDLIEYWRDDPSTDLILMYIESFGDPMRFTTLAREITRKKPIIAVKAGRTRAGIRAASSHTGAMANVDVASEALFEQCGVLRVTSVEELFDMAMALCNQPVPRGDGVAIITNAGGPGIMAVDACENLGLRVTNFSDETVKRLKKALPPVVTVQNPIDLIASAGAQRYKAALEIIQEDENVHSILIIFVPPITTDPLEISSVIHEVSRDSNKTFLGCFMGREEVLRKSSQAEGKIIPIYSFPESAMLTLSLMDKYRRWLERPRGKVRRFDVTRKKVEQILSRAQRSKRVDLTQDESYQVFEAYGIPMARFKMVSGLEEVVSSAESIGYPVALKISDPGISHKTEVGGVILDIRDNGEMVKAFQKLKKSWDRVSRGKKSGKFMVQEMVEGGQETILGMNLDPAFGPLIMFGLGGIYVEYLKDVSFRVLPITDVDTDDMIRSIRGYRLLEGVRGEKPSDLKALAEAIGRLAQLVTDFPVIKQLDVNPFIVLPAGKGTRGVDARISLAEQEKNSLIS
jgi:acetyltransferase